MKKNWLIGIFIFICLTCSALLLPKPTLTGDGIEYLTMCVSFKNHHSFDRQNEDISTVRKTLMMSSSDIENSLKYGYFKPLREGGGGSIATTSGLIR